MNKAISVKNPWAYLIVSGIKPIENRTWSTKFRGRVLIHASGQLCNPVFTSEQEYDIKRLMPVNDLWRGNIQGAIVGSVEIVDCVINHSSIWAEKTEGVTDVNTKEFIPSNKQKPIYNWVLKNPTLFENPILNIKGKLSFWDYNGEIPE